MDPGSLIAIISVSFTSLGALMTGLFHSMSLSRCTKIGCCGCFCERQVLSEETYRQQENKKQRTHLAQPVHSVAEEEE